MFADHSTGDMYNFLRSALNFAQLSSEQILQKNLVSSANLNILTHPILNIIYKYYKKDRPKD